ERPAILPIRKSEKINLIAIGLLKDQILKKHKAAIPTLLTVLKGSIEFRIENDKIRLLQFDTYQIPVNIEHEVEGKEERNVFTLTQEK
ncbi:hypothetical protein, partial [Xanthovirga aplysinae]|uniref:hypothetical protein n=1 Tax=Xanthovirga aplysinae TaxID=2529853 RepID=UPI001CA408DB